MAENLLQLEVVAPDHQALSTEVESVVVRTPDGEIGFLANHAALIAALVPQVVRFKDAAGKDGHIFVGGGFVEVNNNHVVILSPSAETADQIDYDRALRAEHRAEERLAHKGDGDIDVARAEIALKRALERLKMKQYV
ncbi:MAG: ATP synthase F1 subunit epsilon [Peptococcaceae bacterium]|nr:ATP synthase F1 subunit epsilon [Peptococcaceae bacterium]